MKKKTQIVQLFNGLVDHRLEKLKKRRISRGFQKVYQKFNLRTGNPPKTQKTCIFRKKKLEKNFDHVYFFGEAEKKFARSN